MELVKKYGKVFGYFDGLRPNLWVSDPDLIKAICVKDFNHFTDRRVKKKKRFSLITLKYPKPNFAPFQHFEVKHKIMKNWLALSRGQEWKDIRSSVSPAFTTSKIKQV